jgi:DNA-binding transcriptional LysR family regulator
MDAPVILSAAPAYLARHGTPCSPSELADQALILGPAHPSPTLACRKDGRLVSVQVDSRLAVTIDEGAIASAVAGLGIAVSCMVSARDALDAGALVRVLPDWDLGSMEVNALFVSDKPIKPAARALAAFLRHRLRSQAARSSRAAGASSRRL